MIGKDREPIKTAINAPIGLAGLTEPLPFPFPLGIFVFLHYPSVALITGDDGRKTALTETCGSKMRNEHLSNSAIQHAPVSRLPKSHFSNPSSNYWSSNNFLDQLRSIRV
jgi:hypothetical protein